MNSENYYAVLGLKSNCYWFDIKKAYRKKAKENHPDKGGSDESFKIIERAFKNLNDQDLRIKYDVCNSYSDTNLKTNIIETKMSVRQIVYGEPLEVSFFKKSFCDCGFEKDCKFCEGGGIKEEEVFLVLRDTKKYYHGMRIILNEAGNVDRYGRKENVILVLSFELSGGYKLSEFENSLIYFMNFNFDDIKSIIYDNKIHINLPNLNFFSIPLDNIDENSYIAVNERLKIKLIITISNVKQFLTSNFKQQTTNNKQLRRM